MKMNEICQSCSKDSVHLTGLCGVCYNQKINRKALARIEVKFKPKSEENQLIFDKYLESLKERKVRAPDLAVAKQFSEHLTQNRIGLLNSWSDVFETSKKLNICYPQKPKYGCPILQVGRALARTGIIGPLRFEKSICRSRVSALLSSQTQALVKEYFIEITKKRCARYGLITISVVRRFEASLNAMSLLEVTEEEATNFIEKIPKDRLRQTREYIRHLKVFYNWLVGKGLIEKNPFRSLLPPTTKTFCSSCKKEKSFSHRGAFCMHCYVIRQRDVYISKIENLAKEAELPHEYNRQIFKLYVKYIRRYFLDGTIVKDSKLFFQFLQIRADLPKLTSWKQIGSFSLDFEKFVSGQSSLKTGCPVMKTAQLLQEFGILPLREDSAKVGVEEKIAGLNPHLIVPCRRYVERLRKTKRSEKTININIQGIKKFHDWLDLNHKAEFWSASEEMLRAYLFSCKTDKSNARQALDLFYRWAKSERYTLSNPLENIPPIYKKPSLHVCSSEQIKMVEKFIKSPQSDPESAMILALIFYWGATCKEIAQSNVEFKNQNLTITYHRGELSHGNRGYRRNQTLRLPEEPSWLKILKKRFEKEWLKKYQNLNCDLLRCPLILNTRGHLSRPMHSMSIRKKYYKAIKAATGVRIPPNVLRRSGADTYSKQNATAILTRMGWSKRAAYNFIWMPRQFFNLK